MAQSLSSVLQAYSPPLSLWNLVEQHVPIFEQEEVKSMLGSHIVDQSLELHSEIELLLDIWRDMRDEVQETKLVQSRLPEPPNQRERLIQEINFFAESVKEKAKQKGIDPKDILKKHNNDVIEYASDLSRPGSSMGRSSRSSDGRETPMMAASPDRISRAFEVTDQVEAVNKQLNVNKFDEVCGHLRSTLEKEVDCLLADIEFLQSCLDNEANIRDSIDTPQLSREPTLTELREERASLEKELLLTDLTYTPQVDKPLFNDNFQKLLPSPRGSPPVQPVNTPSKQIPMKANHLMSPQTNSDRQVTAQPSTRRLSSRTGGDVPLKAVHNMQLTKVQTEGCKEESISPRTSRDFSRGSAAFLPSPPKVSMSENNSKQHASKSNQDLSSNDSSNHSSQIREGVTVSRVNRGRRTLSPGRVKVVNLSNIVGVHSGKVDSVSCNDGSMDDLRSSNPLLPYSPVPPNSTSPSMEMRPSSADRFRTMVMGCRDGE